MRPRYAPRHVSERSPVERAFDFVVQHGDALGSPGDTRRFLEARLRGYTHEVFACLFLDTRNRMISFDEMFHGTIDGASVHPREVVRKALQHNAAGLIIAHNHD